MPTGYTSKIVDGISFREYALTCARAFGALIDFRDENSNFVIPDEIKVDDYHLDRLMNASLELKKYMGMYPKDLALETDVLYNDEMRGYKNGIKSRKNLENKYKNMLIQVDQYVSPTPDHEDFRKFMRTQIESSIEFDCPSGRETPQPSKKSPEEFQKRQIDSALRSIEYHSKEYKKALDRAADKTKWLKHLMESLEPYKKNGDRINVRKSQAEKFTYNSDNPYRSYKSCHDEPKTDVSITGEKL